MPYQGEPASATSHFDIIRNPEVSSFLQGCRYNPDVSDRVAEIQRCMVDVTDQVLPVQSGVLLATDGSPYEAVVEPQFPSVRVGFLKFSNVLLSLAEYDRLRRSNSTFIDPLELARIKRSSTSLSLALPGAGISDLSGQSSRCFFRQEIFESFCRPELATSGQTLLDTLSDLLRRMGALHEDGNGPAVRFRQGTKCPATGTALDSDVFVPLAPGFITAPSDPSRRIYVTDVLRVHEAFVDEGSNIEAFNRLMNAIEHVLIAHLLRTCRRIDPTITDNLYVIVDGPLALFGEPARFHRGIMHLINEIAQEARQRGQPGPLVLGLSKTGKVAEHATVIDRILQSADGGETRRDGTWLLPISDDYRSAYVQPHSEVSSSNFGDETYYGQTFLLRTSKGKVFDVCIAYPFGSKDPVNGVPFRDCKVDLSHYQQEIGRAVSLIEAMQMDLYDNSMIAVHLAHKYASIAHAPGGRSLEQFVRELVQARQ